MNQSISSDAPNTERYFEDEFISNKRKVKVYIRAVTRKSIKIELPAQISLEKLQEIIWKKFHITYQNQVMYLKGTCLNYNVMILLENNWIIHVIDIAQVQLPEIAVQIKAASLTKKKSASQKIVISPRITINRFIQDHVIPQYQVNPEEILLVESGRILKQNGTFLQLNIQNGTTINLIHSKKDQFSQSTINLSQISESKSNLLSNPESKNEVDLIQTIQKSDWKTLNINKNTQNQLCLIHQNKKSLQKNFSQKILSHRQFSKTQRQFQVSSSIKNISTQVGERECNCKKQKQIELIKEPKFITIEDKKRLSKQIREQNLQKLMKIKQKKSDQLCNSPLIQKKTLSKIRSLGQLKASPLTERKKPVKIVTNPQNHIKY